jgi:hypothetical protein
MELFIVSENRRDKQRKLKGRCIFDDRSWLNKTDLSDGDSGPATKKLKAGL